MYAHGCARAARSMSVLMDMDSILPPRKYLRAYQDTCRQSEAGRKQTLVHSVCPCVMIGSSSSVVPHTLSTAHAHTHKHTKHPAPHIAHAAYGSSVPHCTHPHSVRLYAARGIAKASHIADIPQHSSRSRWELTLAVPTV